MAESSDESPVRRRLDGGAEPAGDLPRVRLSAAVEAAREGDPVAATGPTLADAGALRNTIQQFGAQIAGLVFTGGLGLYLVRALGPSQYGTYSLAVSIVTLALYPAGLGLPYAIGRFLADHRSDVGQLRAIFRLGSGLQLAAAAVCTVALLALANPLAAAFDKPGLAWPLRWIALSIGGQAGYSYLAAVATSLRRSSVTFWMALVESAVEAAAAVGLVVGGAGAAGAVLGKTIGYTVSGVLGVMLIRRLLGVRRGSRSPSLGLRVGEVLRYAQAMLVVDVAWSAIGQLDIVLIGALLSASAVGGFSAVFRVLTLLSYPGLAVAGGVAPRLSRVDGEPDVGALIGAVRFLILVEAVAIAPMIVWAHPLTRLLFGAHYTHSAEILAVLTVQAFASAPNALLSLAVTYLGEARQRLKIVLGTLVIGLAVTYVLVRLIGAVGAAIADDLVQVVYLSAHLIIAARLIEIDYRPLARSLLCALVAAAGMAVPLLIAGHRELSLAGWVLGGAAGLAVYAGVLLLTRELRPSELRALLAGRLSG